MPDAAFFTLHRDLPREGPGEAADVLWALRVTGITGKARVCDAACGPGADTVTLAEALPDARIDAIEKQPHFVAQAQNKVDPFGDRVSVTQGDMWQLTGPYDLVWCAGAVYFRGVTEALKLWRPALKPGGYVAFSDPVLTSANPATSVVEFWEGEADVGDLAGLEQKIEAAGYKLLGHRMIIGQPWANYYEPMEARIAKLRATGVSDDVEAALQEGEREIALWRAAPDEIAYALCVVTPR